MRALVLWAMLISLALVPPMFSWSTAGWRYFAKCPEKGISLHSSKLHYTPAQMNVLLFFFFSLHFLHSSFFVFSSIFVSPLNQLAGGLAWLIPECQLTLLNLKLYVCAYLISFRKIVRATGIVEDLACKQSLKAVQPPFDKLSKLYYIPTYVAKALPNP